MLRKTKLPEKLPKHIGFILDGNGRWASSRGLPRNFGHKAGIDAVKRTIKALIKFKIPYASMFAFSTENWKRSKEEVDGIFNLVRNLFIDDIDALAWLIQPLSVHVVDGICRSILLLKVVDT